MARIEQLAYRFNRAYRRSFRSKPKVSSIEDDLRSNWLAFLIAPSFPRTLARNDMTEINYFLDFRFHAYFYLFTLCRSGTLHGRTRVVWINLRESTCESTSFRQTLHVEIWQFIVKLLTYPASLSVFSLVDSRGELKCHHWKFTNWSRLNSSLRSRHRTEKSLRTDNNSFIVLKNPNQNNRQSLNTLACSIVVKHLGKSDQLAVSSKFLRM